ncbi:MAG: class I poly(R)-hydroxyalkanoic acid synthase [Pseudomonadota bacterium]
MPDDQISIAPLMGESAQRVVDRVTKLDDLSRRLVKVAARGTSANPALNIPDPEIFQQAAFSYWSKAVHNPIEAVMQQIAFWSATAQNVLDSQSLFGSEIDEHSSADRRFANPLWDSNTVFHLIKEQYLLNASTLQNVVKDAETLDPKDRQRLAYFVEQIVNLMAPNNFIGVNPDAFFAALDSEGDSLISGLANLVQDLEANDGDLVVRLADETAFEIGENIATTPGEVVYRNRIMELIQYHPTTAQVRETPIVLFPPWINKFYILDLKEKNSLIKYITDQGYTLFVVSWFNPTRDDADVGLEDYIEDGYLTAIQKAKEICNVPQINAVGYCIAGTTLSLTLSLLKQRGDTSVNSATFFTTLTDFSDQGEFTPFLQEDFIDNIEDEVTERGVLSAHIMGRTFSFLRSNDLVYGPAIRNYYLGETPPAFDLLYWNGDGTNLPAKMVVQYLRKICQSNEFAQTGIDLLGHTLKLGDVDLPLMSIACEADHIARWKDCYRGVQKMGSGNKSFIVSESGHIAGIVNPPSKKKYGHYSNADISQNAEAWLENAQFTEGSWWPTWENWVRGKSGPLVSARNPENSLGSAPGTYILKQKNAASQQ